MTSSRSVFLVRREGEILSVWTTEHAALQEAERRAGDGPEPWITEYLLDDPNGEVIVNAGGRSR